MIKYLRASYHKFTPTRWSERSAQRICNLLVPTGKIELLQMPYDQEGSTVRRTLSATSALLTALRIAYSRYTPPAFSSARLQGLLGLVTKPHLKKGRDIAMGARCCFVNGGLLVVGTVVGNPVRAVRGLYG